MDFFGRQAEARRATWKLVGLFVLAIPCIAALIYLGVAAVLRWQGVTYFGGFWSWRLFLDVLAFTAFVVAYGSLTRMQDLKKGGRAVARRLGARPISPDTQDLGERRLLNVVEEMSIASGLPVPNTWLMPDDAINAFAAGWHPGDAVVAVTRGCIQQLTRDELQGVIAHEFSHVLNGDMRLNLRLMGVTHGLVNITVVGTTLMRGGSSAPGMARVKRTGGPLLTVGGVLIAAGFVGVVFARLIKAAVSRQREFLADAAAVQFTRNAKGIGGALKKIGGFARAAPASDDAGDASDHANSHANGHANGQTNGHPSATRSLVWNGHAEEASHMFFAAALESRFDAWFATHPPIVDRIRRIEPGFRHAAARGARAASVTPQTAIDVLAFAPAAPSRTVTAEQLVDGIGVVTPEVVDRGSRILTALPFSLRAAVHSPAGARAVVYALLLDRVPSRRRTQLRAIEGTADPQTLQEASSIATQVAELHVGLRLPLIDLAVPALRAMSPDEYRVFRDGLDALCERLDVPRRDLFAYCLSRVLLRHLGAAFADRSPRRAARSAHAARARGVKSRVDDARVVIGSLALAGHDDPKDVRRAFADGLRVVPGADPTLLTPPDRLEFAALDAALDRIARRSSYERRTVLLGCARAVASDRVLRYEEAELLRAIADGLDCPIPPMPLDLPTPPAEVRVDGRSQAPAG